jgi:hypothetical protein
VTALSGLVPMLQREVQPPGTDLFPDAVGADWIGYLADGFCEAQLDGFLSKFAIDLNTNLVTPDLPVFYQYLIVLWAGVRITRTRISNLRAQQRSKAGPVEFEFANSATVLKSVLDEIAAKKQRLIDLSYHITDTSLIDAYYQKDFNDVNFIRSDF